MRVIAFYSFFEIKDLNLIKDQINNFFQNLEVKGSILIGPEGLNGTIAVNSDKEKKVNFFLMQLGVFQENIKISNFDGKRVFNKFKINIIVHGHTHRKNIHEVKNNGKKYIRYVLGDWHNSPSYIIYKNNKIELLDF